MTDRIKLALKWFGIFLLGKILERILDKSGATDYMLSLLPTHNGLYKFLTYSFNVPVWNLVLIGMFMIPSYFIISTVFKRYFKKQEINGHTKTKQEIFYETWDKFKQQNRFNTIVEKENIAFKTDLNWAGDNMYINSLYPYCTKHGEPARMAPEKPDGNFLKCHKPDCNNSIGSFWIKKAETEILSDLENKWDKFGTEVVY